MDASVSGQIYANFGYDFLAITDHNMAHTPEQWQKWQAENSLTIIPGEENGSKGHILELGVYEVTPTGTDNYTERAKLLRQAGGFVVGCHPQEYPGCGEDDIRDAVGMLHGFEIFNGLREGRGHNEMANVVLWDKILTSGGRIWGVATDDFHCAYVTPGHGWVSVQVPEDTPNPVDWGTIVQQLKAGAFISSTYPALEKITLESDDTSSDKLVVEARGTRELRVIGDGGTILHRATGNHLEWKVESKLTYFRVEAVSGIKRGWSQPFYRES
jgi:hypothetical protein